MIKATQRRCIIKANEMSKETAGGIFVNYTGETQTATIIAVGSQCESGLEVGNVVLVDWNTTVPIKHEDQSYFVIDERGVLAVLGE